MRRLVVICVLAIVLGFYGIAWATMSASVSVSGDEGWITVSGSASFTATYARSLFWITAI